VQADHGKRGGKTGRSALVIGRTPRIFRRRTTKGPPERALHRGGETSGAR
jgi:hypothetical protein